MHGTRPGVSSPSELVAIRYKAFKFCGALVHIDLPEGLATINDKAFFACQSIDHAMRAHVRAMNHRAF